MTATPEEIEAWSLKRLAWAYGCAKKGSSEEDGLRQALVSRLHEGNSAIALAHRLQAIAEIIEAVDWRCMAGDGRVTPTLDEMTQDEMLEIYALATGGRKAGG